jgi:hypothetical protein
MVVIPQIHEET